jgi:hypothetical protein
MKTKQERIEAVNQIITEIANRGRQFFRSKSTGIVSHFYLAGEKNQRLWYMDKRGGKVNPYPSHSSRDDHFSDGGTLWGLMQDFSEFIRTGKDSNGKNGYGGLNCSHWGYPEEDMEAIRKVAIEVGYLSK